MIVWGWVNVNESSQRNIISALFEIEWHVMKARVKIVESNDDENVEM